MACEVKHLAGLQRPRHFFKDVADPLNYDLVLNAPRLSVVQRAEVIVEVLQRLQASRTGKYAVGASAR